MICKSTLLSWALALAGLLGAVPALAQAPPGNALAFDGQNDYVALPTTAPLPTGNASYTLEAWIKPTVMSVEGIVGWGNWGTTNQVNALRLDPSGVLYNYWWGNDLGANVGDLSGRWHHVAATFDGLTRTLYLDGAAVASDRPTGHAVPYATNARIGSTCPGPCGGEYFSGGLDEVRVWSVARSAADIKAAYTNWAAAPQTGLVAAYNLDQGTAGADNTAATALPDQSGNASTGTLTNFALASGNTTSNYVESYALVVPQMRAPTALTSTSATLNWAAPALGSASNGYVLDYGTSPAFTSGTTLTLAAGTTSQTLSGLAPNSIVYYRLRADKTSVTGTGAYASGTLRMPSGLAPPGNALAFDGADDYVSGTNANLPQGNAARTIEAWVYYPANGSNGVVFNYGTASSNQRASLMLVGNKLYYAGENNDAAGAMTVSANQWHHVAATYDGTTLKLYLDGLLDRTATMSAFSTAGTSWVAGGRLGGGSELLAGRLDEVRVYSVALTQAQLQADMTSTSPAVPGSLVAYYNMDQGTANASNAANTTLLDQSPSLADGTLTNFSLASGNTTSNWVESYALVVPTGLAATSTPDGTTLNATWVAPAIDGAAAASGIVEGYVLDVSTSATFATGVTSYPVAGAGTISVAATGLTSGTPYYLRVRANKASVNNQGTYSATLATHTLNTEARLTNLTVPVSALSPAFATATTAYTLPLAAGQNSFTLTPTASSTYTSITANGVAVASGASTASYPAGTLVTLVLTSENGQTTSTYTVQSINTPDYYRSVASGNWGDLGTWEGSDNNATWSPVPFAPSAGPQPTTANRQPIITIQAGHTVTVAAFVQANRTTVASGGTLALAPGTSMEFINSGAGGYDLTVNGTLTVPATAVLLMGRLTGANGYTGASSTGSALLVNSGGSFTASGTVLLNTGGTPVSLAAGTTIFNAGSRVILFGTTATPVVPVATWDPAATLELGGTTSTAFNYSGSFAGKTFGNVDITMTGAGTPLLLTGTGTATIAGNLTVTRGTTTNLLRLISAGTTAALTIGGNYVQNSGAVTGYLSANATGNGAAAGVSVAGSFLLRGGTYTANQITSITVSTIRPTPLAVAGNLSVSSGATFYLVSSASATVNYPSGVTLGGDFANAGAFSTFSTVASNSNQQLYFTKAGVQNFVNTGTIGNAATNRVNVTVNAGSTLDMGTSAFTGSGTFNTVAGSTLRLGSPDGISASGTATGNVQNTAARGYGGNIELNGTVAQNTGLGFPAIITTTLVVNNPAGVTLTQPLAVTGTLSLRQGVVTSTATNLLTLGSSGSTLGTLDPVATNTGYVLGPLRRWVAAATGATAFPVGTAAVPRPAGISYTAAPAAGTLTAEFVGSPAGSQGLPLSEGGITAAKGSDDGYWHFTAADGLVGGTYDATFTFAGITGVSDYSQLLLLKRPNAASDWALLGSPVATTGTNTAPVLSRTGLSGFSDFTASLNPAPLPVELVSFTATAQGAAAALAWATATERNSARFEVERSRDGVAFAKVGEVAAAGTTAHAHRYTSLDRAAPAGQLYYRLRQVDLDGSAHYSPVRSVALGSGLAVYPNPAHGLATLSGAAPGQMVQVLDALGRLVLFATADANGRAALALPAGLPAGMYLVRAGQQARRLTVE